MLPGVHPLEWDGSPVVLHPGVCLMRRIEPLWRQLSVLADAQFPPELTAIRAMTLFSRSVELSLPTLLIPEQAGDIYRSASRYPIAGNLASQPHEGLARRMAELLRQRMAEPWTVRRLCTEVALSRTHLTRLFTSQMGIPPIRFLAEARLTEFTRLVEETDMPIGLAARQV